MNTVFATAPLVDILFEVLRIVDNSHRQHIMLLTEFVY